MLNTDDFVISALVEEGVLTRVQVEQARRSAASKGVPLMRALTDDGFIGVRELAIARAQTNEFPYADLSHYEINFQNASLISRDVAESMIAFPLFVCNGIATVAMANPLDLRAVDQLRTILKLDIEPVLSETESIAALIGRAYALSGSPGKAASARSSDDGMADSKEPIVAAVNQIIAQGVELGASDIHIGPDEHELHLRYRVDGVLRAHQGPGLGAHQGIVQRLKVMANLDLTQTRRPQDGKIRFVHNNRPIDLRLSIIPTVCGENAVLRILHSGATIKDFAALGVAPGVRERLEALLESPYGMMLVTGPTGSGKTTTLYTALKRINTPDLNIVTIEDPVEIRIPLIRQVQVNSEIGMTFAGALRSVLRQDPDVVFVGEIRDEETARISVQAALTGHLVLSSLHTNDAAGAIPRLKDLGCPAFAINAALLGVVAQRLVRKACSECSAAIEPDASLLRRFGFEPGQHKFIQGRGCAKCGSSGFKGRLGVYELLAMSEALRRLVDSGGVADDIRRIATAEGMRLMWQDGLDKALVGQTTLQEIAGVVAVQDAESTAGRIEQAEGRRAAA